MSVWYFLHNKMQDVPVCRLLRAALVLVFFHKHLGVIVVGQSILTDAIQLKQLL